MLNGRNKPVFREFGEMLFTHFGVSGPLMLSASAHLRRWDKEQYRLVIDLKPALDEQKLDDPSPAGACGRIPTATWAMFWQGWCIAAWYRCCCAVWHLPEGEKANSLTREQRRVLVQELKHFAVPLTGPRPVAEAIVTAGGVKVGEVDAQYHGLQADGRAVLCRRGAGRGRLHRRLQPCRSPGPPDSLAGLSAAEK